MACPCSLPCVARPRLEEIDEDRVSERCSACPNLSSAAAPCQQVVVQGSTRGLGLALARQFLSLGDDVVVSSRDATAVQACVQQLQQEFPGRRVVAAPADATQPAQVEALAAAAVHQLGRIVSWGRRTAPLPLPALQRVPMQSRRREGRREGRQPPCAHLSAATTPPAPTPTPPPHPAVHAHCCRTSGWPMPRCLRSARRR